LRYTSPARAEGAVDSAISLEPGELAIPMQESEQAWQALCDVRDGPIEDECNSLQLRKTIYVGSISSMVKISQKQSVNRALAMGHSSLSTLSYWACVPTAPSYQVWP
jgi:hypothetical protein